MTPGIRFNICKLTVVMFFMTATTFSYGKVQRPFDVKTVFYNIFEVKAVNNSVDLTWTVTEYNNKNFVIQHSLNGADWEDVAFIASQNSVESLVDYDFKLSNIAPGRHYYRLKHIDNDLTKTGYSPIKFVVVSEDKTSVGVWPNPATNVINISNYGKGSSAYTTGSIVDLSGRKMTSLKLEQGVNTVNIANLPIGVYFLYLENGDANPFNQKFIKQ